MQDTSHRRKERLDDNNLGRRSSAGLEGQNVLEKPSKFPIGPVAVGCLVVAGMLALILMLGIGRRNRALEESKGETPSFGSGSAKDWKGLLPLKAAKGFVLAKTVEERLQFVRDPKRVEPMMRHFFSEGPGAKESLAALVPVRSIQTRDMAAEEFRADFKDGGHRLVCVVLERDTSKVDFECYARHGSVPWEDLLSGKAQSAEEVRLIVSAQSYYNFGFSDDHKWKSFSAHSPDVPFDLVLYAELGSKTEHIMSEMTATDSVLTTLAIRGVQDSHKHRQFEVTRVLAQAWVTSSQSR